MSGEQEQSMRVLSYPAPFLRRQVKPVQEITPELVEIVRGMFQTMYSARGVGLAASQVGLDMSLFVLNVTGEPDDEHVFINPEIVELRGDTLELEGCLSLPGLEAKVRRSAYVRIRAQDLQGEFFEMEGEDFLARALQHETDHLNGTLFIDKIGPASRIALKSRLTEMEERQTRQT